MTLESRVLEKITPSAKEVARMLEVVESLETVLDDALSARRIPGKARVQGSVAKGTWLRSSADLDCFLLLDPTVELDALKDIAADIGERVLTDVRQKYAQHPYIVGRYEGLDVDLVPAYAVGEAASKMSAVDRTPFHTAWVASHLDDAGLAQVRLLKQWCKGVGVYGAETAIGGFSGYLLEILVARFGAFISVLEWLKAGNYGRIHMGLDEVEDKVSTLIVVDPVDPARNCAAAVRRDVLARAAEAATDYLDAPSMAFFFPPEPKADRHLGRAADEQGLRWIGLRLTPETDRLDIVYPQFQKVARQISEELDRAGWPITRSVVSVEADDVMMQWLADARVLDDERIQTGPPGDTEHASRFHEKWQDHPDALAPVFESEGRLRVRVAVRERTALEYLHRHLERLLAPKHVKAAWNRDGEVLGDPDTVPAPWPPTVADLILDRRPWNR